MSASSYTFTASGVFPPKIMRFVHGHLENTLSSTLGGTSPTVKFSNLKQLANPPLESVVTSGSSTVVNSSHRKNAHLPIVVAFGKLTIFILLQSSNTKSSTVTISGKIIVSN